jgi:hypothetical protein
MLKIIITTHKKAQVPREDHTSGCEIPELKLYDRYMMMVMMQYK